MHIEFLVEEPSAEAALQSLVPKIVGPGVSSAFHVHQGKRDLLARLPERLRGYSRWLPKDWRIVILTDLDRQDCRKLKDALEQYARDAGLTTRSISGVGGRFQVLNRIAIEELEAWFFGDMSALIQAYPRIPKTLTKRVGYREPDAIRGGTWETLERLLQKLDYYPGGLPKIEVARRVSQYMDPDRNRSKSFQVFRQGVRELAAIEQP